MGTDSPLQATAVVEPGMRLRVIGDVFEVAVGALPPRFAAEQRHAHFCEDPDFPLAAAGSAFTAVTCSASATSYTPGRTSTGNT